VPASTVTDEGVTVPAFAGKTDVETTAGLLTAFGNHLGSPALFFPAKLGSFNVKSSAEAFRNKFEGVFSVYTVVTILPLLVPSVILLE